VRQSSEEARKAVYNDTYALPSVDNSYARSTVQSLVFVSLSHFPTFSLSLLPMDCGNHTNLTRGGGKQRGVAAALNRHRMPRTKTYRRMDM
jgi:hypothetical protein